MQDDSLWQAVLGEIELSVSHGNFVTWFKGTSLLKQSDETIVIGVANIFIKQQLERKYGELIAKTLAKNGLVAKQIDYKIISSQSRKPNNSKTPEATTQTPGKSPSTNNSGGAQPQSGNNGLTHSYRQGLNERYTLDSFIVGDSNELAFAACQAVAAQPGTKYNPLFLYGGVG
ncbi:MAG TPA: DnaA/Hda family protein, partial [Candidatus Saccharimonadales bacterium]